MEIMIKNNSCFKNYRNGDIICSGCGVAVECYGATFKDYNYCDICKLGIDNCQDVEGNPINLDSLLAACLYDNENEYRKALELMKV